jgi:hypothetical protein
MTDKEKFVEKARLYFKEATENIPSSKKIIVSEAFEACKDESNDANLPLISKWKQF